MVVTQKSKSMLLDQDIIKNKSELMFAIALHSETFENATKS